MGRAEGHAVGWRAARRSGGAGTEVRDCERRDSQLDGPNAPGRVASEERAAMSVRRAGGEATVWALDSAANVRICSVHGSSAQTVASAAARFAGRGPFLTLRRCEGGTGILRMNAIAVWELLARIAIDCIVIVRNSRDPPNALTLSCKNRLPCRPPESGAAAARLTRSSRSELQPT